MHKTTNVLLGQEFYLKHFSFIEEAKDENE